MDKYDKKILNVNSEYIQFKPNVPDSTKERISSEIYNSPLFIKYQEIFNKPVTQRDSTFIKNAQEIEKFNKLRNYYNKVKIIPLYSNKEFDEEYNKLDSLYKAKPEDDIYILGHNADRFFGIDTGELNYRLKNATYNNCYLGTCHGAERIISDFPKIENMYGYTGTS
jgi:hypothetical protein